MLFVNSLKLYIYISQSCTEVQMCGYSVSFIKILGVLIYHSYLAKALCLCSFPSNCDTKCSGTNNRFFTQNSEGCKSLSKS